VTLWFRSRAATAGRAEQNDGPAVRPTTEVVGVGGTPGSPYAHLGRRLQRSILMKKTCLLLAWVGHCSLSAEVKLPPHFASHMVLQRENEGSDLGALRNPVKR